MLDEQQRHIERSKKRLELLRVAAADQRLQVGDGDLLRDPLHVSVGERVVVGVLGDLRERANEAPVVGLSQLDQRVEHVSVERTAGPLTMEGEGGVAEDQARVTAGLLADT